MKKLIYFLIVALIVSWVLGFVVFKVLGTLIHLLLLLAAVLLVYNWFTNKKT
tara:strand:- start:41977 stop:42132 length:156 start_codon:yes stop_codon:yes gene_type:complete